MQIYVQIVERGNFTQAADALQLHRPAVTKTVQQLEQELGVRLRALATNGTFFQYGALDTRDIPVPVMDLLARHLTLRGYELFEITGDAQRLERAKRFIVDGLAAGTLKPRIDRTFAFDDIVSAHRYMEAGAQVGKIVVTV
ncbi:zinc-binding dehydrogenase [Burkholderia metallica]|nr:zinc-binding dehydrogenase [Burkholderia metallica]